MCEVYCPTRSCRQLRYNQQLPRDSGFTSFHRDKLDGDQCVLTECIHRQTGSTLAVLAHHLVRNVSIHYARLWGGVVGATCMPFKYRDPHHCQVGKRGGGPCPVRSNLKIHPSSRSLPHPKVGGGEVVEIGPGPRREQRLLLLKGLICEIILLTSASL